MRRNHHKDNTAGSSTVAVGCLTLFGVPFALVGCYLLYSVCSVLILYSRSGSWQPTPATLEQLDLVGGSTQRSTIRVKGRYSYYYGGQRYTSERITLSDEQDNNRTFHQGLFDSLNEKRRRGEQITCLVDPHHPDQAIINRDLRTTFLVVKLAGALIFGGICLGIILLAFSSGRDLRKIEKLEAHSSGTGWKYRDDWAQGYIRNNSSNNAIGYGIAAIFVLAMSLPGLFALRDKLFVHKEPLALALLVFPILGSAFLVWAVRSYLVWKRFGKARLRIVPTPILQATHIEGRMELNTHLPPEITTVEAVLTCTRIRKHQRRRITIHLGSGDNSSYHSDMPKALFSQRLIGRVQRHLHGTTILYTFSVPTIYPPTTVISERETIRWSLRARASLPGADLDLDFDLPVFQMSNV
jgi:hypothetical protein